MEGGELQKFSGQRHMLNKHEDLSSNSLPHMCT